MIVPVPFTAVRLTDSFWQPRLEINRTVTLPFVLRQCAETGRTDNFAKAAGRMAGAHEGYYFNDSDVYKALEGAAYTLHTHPDPALESQVDELIELIAAAQEEDGYLYTARTIDPEAVTAEREGLTRWSNLPVNHELYNVGHLYEAAVAYYRATGKRSLLAVALRNAKLIGRVFGENGRHDVPGHEEIEIGLVKLYQVTGERSYLQLAQFFLDERGRHDRRALSHVTSRGAYAQDHLPVTGQREAVGHAVRAAYLYTGMADVAVLTGHEGYLAALQHIWQDVAAHKLHLTGGIGARHEGEAFGEAYELPDETAYNETCAAIGNILWHYRLFLLTGDGRLLDVLERTLYNGFLAGISLAGDRFFYPNPLAADGVWPFNKGFVDRQPWFACACCPPNVARFLPQLPQYLYATDDDHVYVNLYMANTAVLSHRLMPIRIRQVTDYPWNGRVQLTLDPERTAAFGLRLRLPGWAQNQPVPSDLYRYADASPEPVTIQVNGEGIRVEPVKGFVTINRTWQAGDTVEIMLPMPVRRVLCHEQVAANRGRVALERGPLVYCVEGVDNGRLNDLYLPDDAALTVEHRPDLLGGVMVIRGEGERPFLAVPYYAWANRDVGEMAVWLPRAGNQ
jgi:DUF1680 family protein